MPPLFCTYCCSVPYDSSGQLAGTKIDRLEERELQETSGADYLDFLAREYDLKGAMFLGVDPLAE